MTILILFFSWIFVAPAQAAGLNDTGITTCSNETQNGLPCPVSGFPRQDAEVGRDAEAAAGTLTKIGGGNAGFDFTKLDANGNELPASATNHSCVRDNVTGLMWEVKTDDNGLRDKDWSYTWYDTNSPDGNQGTASGGTCYKTGRCDTEKFVQDVNTAGLCSFKDWRMPTKKELFGIVDRGRYDPAIDTNYFPNTNSSWFWSGSPYAGYSSNAWSVHFYYGNADGNFRDGYGHVRLVRAGQ